MSAKELRYKRLQENSQSVMSKTVISSVLASLLVAFAINSATFIITMSKMSVVLEQIERRVSILETETKTTRDSKHLLEVTIAKQGQIFDRMQADIKEIKEDIRTFHRN